MSFFAHPVGLIRHGQTQMNLEKRTQGHLDSPLTELGISQAHECAIKLLDIAFSTIISSPLGRALHTARIIAETHNIETVIEVHHLMERNFGVLQGARREESIARYPQLWSSEGVFIRDREIPDGEPFEAFITRIQKAISLIAEHAAHGPIIVVTHDSVLHVLMSQLEQQPIEEIQKKYAFAHGVPIIV